MTRPFAQNNQLYSPSLVYEVQLLQSTAATTAATTTDFM